MRKLIGSVVLMLTLFSTFGFAENLDRVVEVQNKLSADYIILESAHEFEQSFLEDILRRKNQTLRELIGAQVAAGAGEELNMVLVEQATLLQKLLRLSEVKILELTKLSRKSSGDEKKSLEVEVQKRISTMDTYYRQLAETLRWSQARQLDVVEPLAELKSALQNRAEFLTNAIFYTDTQVQDIKKRLTYVGADEKTLLTTEIVRLGERTNIMALSLESTVGLMAGLGIDVTVYRKILLATTGDINADVLDIDVAFGLLEEWGASFKDWAFENTPSMIVKLTLFLGILYITRVLSRLTSKTVRKSVSHSKMDFSVLMQDFFVSIASKGVIFIGLLVALSQVGIELAPLLTGFGVAGVIIGFALQDTLSNFASGLMILIYRPYDVGDMVKVAGVQGTVKDMSLVSTTVKTIDNQILVIPNNKIWGDVINNITAEKLRRVDMVFGIGYADDIDKAKVVLNDILANHPAVLKKPEHIVKLHTLNTSSVDFVVRPWVKTEDYWEVYWDVTETVKKRFDQENISIPFPQRDVHIYNHDES